MRRRDVLGFFCSLQKHFLRALPDLGTSAGVNQTIACGVKQPRLRFLRDTIRRPFLQRGDERIAERIFRSSNIARTRGEIRNELPIRIAQYRFNRMVRCRFAHGLSGGLRFWRSANSLVS